VAVIDVGAVDGLVVATLAGMAIGLERQWSGHADGQRARFGGIRTFTLLGGIAGVAGWLAAAGLMPLSAILLGAAAAMIVVGYARASRRDIDATTEVAALVVLVAGTLAGAGHLVVASAVAAATALILVEKTRVHAAVHRIDDMSLRASARFAAMACIVLPLLPAGPYGPYDAIRPRALWAFVLFFSGLSFAGWLARRVAGARGGTIASAVLGGLISSTSVTTQLAYSSRDSRAPRLVLGAGAIAACTVMLVRVAIACAVINPALAWTLPRYLVPSFVFGTAIVALVGRSGRFTADTDAPLQSPLQLGAALKMTALFQVVLFIILAVQARWSTDALVATSVFVGLTDVDALTLSLARSASGSVSLVPTAQALAAGVMANTLLKLAVAAVVGRGTFRTVTVLALGAMAAMMLAALARG
jgi:uncharacterized membrane protein (DUF4010 family)